MQGLTAGETIEYCKSRMKLAGSLNDNIFTESALTAIHDTTQGNVRNNNNLVVASLMYCTSKKQEVVDEEAVYQGNLEVAF